MAGMFILGHAVTLTAQGACSGPGAAFGVTSYQCGDCSMQQQRGATTPVWSFRAEPLILKTTSASALQSGDIVEAVNGKPITTAAGARLFSTPHADAANITVRRGGRRLTLHAATTACAEISDAATGAEAPAPAGEPTSVGKRHGRFGFAITCSYCTRQSRPNGTAFWTFTSNPVIGAIEPNGPAGRAGLRSGDVIVAVDGHAVLTAAGASALGQSDRASTLVITVERPDRSRRTVKLNARSDEDTLSHAPSDVASSRSE